MEFMGMTGVLAITIIAFLIGLVAKAFDKIHNEWIPIICGTVGGCLGIPGMVLMPDFPATDYITAVAVGIISGLAATGLNEAYKQIKSSFDK